VERISRLSNHVDVLPSLASKCTTGERINLASSLDSDADELPDWWELQYVANLFAMNETSDLDHDFLSDFVEYRTQSDPANPSSRWGINYSAFSVADGIVLRWSCHADVRYRVLASSSLLFPVCSVVLDNLSVTSPLNEWVAPLTNAPSLFYKVELLRD